MKHVFRGLMTIEDKQRRAVAPPHPRPHPIVFLKPSSSTPAKSTAPLMLSAGSADGLGSPVSTSAKGLWEEVEGGGCVVHTFDDR
jgi:hypothetical protein